MKHLIFILLFLNSICSFSNQALTVGVIGEMPPFVQVANTKDGSYFFGFSIEIMNNICKHMKVRCTYHQVDFNTQLTALDNGSIDVLLLAAPYELTKLSQYALSLPYVLSRVQFVALKNSSLNENIPIQNLKIGVVKATFYDLLKKSQYGSNNQVIPFNSVADLISGLINKKVDLIMLNSAIAYYYMNNNLYQIKSVSKNFQLGQGYGIVALPAQAELIKNINKALLSMQKDGTYLSIFRKYYNQD